MWFVSKSGEALLQRCISARDIASVIAGALFLSVQPGFWPKTVRKVLGRQILFTGFDAFNLTGFIAVLSGMSVVSQAQLWLNKLGQSEMLGAMLVAIIIREIGPLLVNFVVIGRSGTAMATELANMRVNNEIRVLDSHGIDTMQYLLMPRVIGMGLSVFSLSVFFCAIAFISGFFFAVLIQAAPGDITMFTRNIIGAVAPWDIVVFLIKTLVTGFIVAGISCVEGLTIGGSINEVPQAVTRSVVKALAVVLLISALVSVFIYM